MSATTTASGPSAASRIGLLKRAAAPWPSAKPGPPPPATMRGACGSSAAAVVASAIESRHARLERKLISA
jgi:hypothetical protein